MPVHVHEHEFEHRHEHGSGSDRGHHHHEGEGGWEPSRPGTVVLDIGPGLGALVVGCPVSMLGAEIEADPLDWPVSRQRVHTAVRERFVPAGTVYAAVFPALRPGRYRLNLRGDAERALVDCAEVSPGSVTELTAGSRR
jgi:hypothetical protein